MCNESIPWLGCSMCQLSHVSGSAQSAPHAIEVWAANGRYWGGQLSSTAVMPEQALIELMGSPGCQEQASPRRGAR